MVSLPLHSVLAQSRSFCPGCMPPIVNSQSTSSNHSCGWAIDCKVPRPRRVSNSLATSPAARIGNPSLQYPTCNTGWFPVLQPGLNASHLEMEHNVRYGFSNCLHVCFGTAREKIDRLWLAAIKIRTAPLAARAREMEKRRWKHNPDFRSNIQQPTSNIHSQCSWDPRCFVSYVQSGREPLTFFN